MHYKKATPMPQTPPSFPVVHSILDPAALLRHVATHYDIGSPIQCILLRSWINEVYSVQTSRGRFMLKVFRHGWRAPDEVAYEAELMQHLAACGVRVEPPIADSTGATVCLLPAPEGQRPAVLYPMLLGRPPVPPSEAIYHQVGCTIARMHQALDTFVPTQPRRALDVRYLAKSASCRPSAPRCVPPETRAGRRRHDLRHGQRAAATSLHRPVSDSRARYERQKMLSIVPLLDGRRSLRNRRRAASGPEARPASSCKENYLRWDSLGEFSGASQSPSRTTARRPA